MFEVHINDSIQREIRKWSKMGKGITATSCSTKSTFVNLHPNYIESNRPACLSICFTLNIRKEKKLIQSS